VTKPPKDRAPELRATQSEKDSLASAVSRCREATVLTNCPYTKFFAPLLPICNGRDRNLVVIWRVYWLFKSYWGAKMMIEFEGWDVGYADARNGRPSQCPTNLDPISYVSGYREGCSCDQAHISLSAQMKRGAIR
jgi:hypothetical protein